MNTRVCMCCHTAVFTEQLHHTSPTVCVDVLDTEGRRRLRSSVTDTLVVPLTNRSTLGDRAFPVAVEWSTQRWPWVGSTHGLGWVGLGWVGFKHQNVKIAA